ncbi:hypothetical protein ABH931_000055 [Streptacidiphilus sp. MAP12-33]|uniref:hypothetical protein n=1 Tax=Streptacidiphilus sp. MAP12-33 TaxID=3156266 RepID=UPI003515D643
MRTRIAAPVLVGALALAALAAPTAAVAATPGPVLTHASWTSNVFGVSGKTTMGVNITAYDAKGVRSIRLAAFPLALVGRTGLPTKADLLEGPATPATSTTATTETVKHAQVISYHPGDLPPNAFAGEWGVAVLVTAKDGHTTFYQEATTFSWKRADQLAVAANATSVHKGGAVTLKGKLNRANWDLGTWQGYGSQWVKVQFRKAGTGTWVTEQWARTATDGSVRVNLRDYASGAWRLSYGGNAASAAATSGATSVTVK